MDYLPASRTVPTPKAVLGDVAGAPGILPYSHEVHRYMRMVEKASPRVRVFTIGTTEEGREMITVAVSSEANLAGLDDHRARLAKLSDPRTLNMDDAEAEKLVNASATIYYITGAIHSPETGSPTALMELVYRLAVDEAPFIRAIRDGVITLVTPIVEVDGHDRQVDENPPLPRTEWSQRNNNNYQQTGLLVSLSHFAANRRMFLRNFYLKAKRSILKATTEGPAAYVFSADDPRPGSQTELLRILQLQGCEISRATPNLGRIDSTDDMRPGLGWIGLAHVQDFVRQGGLLITADDTSAGSSSSSAWRRGTRRSTSSCPSCRVRVPSPLPVTAG